MLLKNALSLTSRQSKKQSRKYTTTTPLKGKHYRGNIIHSTSITNLEIIEDGVISVGGDGRIVGVVSGREFDQKMRRESDWDVVDYSGKIICPGFIDTHTHAPQYPNVGLGSGVPLLQWLDKYTFPMEAKYQDVDFAKKAYDLAIKRSLKNGITTSCYFGTIHLEASKLLSDIARDNGQRAYVGKVNMDMNSPEFYIEQTDISIRETEEFVNHVLTNGGGLVQPIITPRFAITCTAPLMKELGRIADENNILIQSHISENTDEVNAVLDIHSNKVHYTDIYQKNKLLNDRTIMAHGIYLDDEELDIFHQSGAALSHCPVSNYTLYSGFLNLRNVLEKGVKVGLGSDLSGGYSMNFLESIRSAISVSTVIHHDKDKTLEPLNFREAFWLATVGGSQVIGQEAHLGNFLTGKQFDAQIINPNVRNGPFDILGFENVQEQFEKFLFSGDDRNIESVFVNGANVTRID